MSRRALLAGAGAGLVLAAAPGRALARTDRAPGASRSSRITRGTSLLHADLHNHTLLSDGDGDPELAFASMRDAGLDVAALTDHATISDNLLGSILAPLLPPGASALTGLTRQGWARTGALADAHDRPGEFTAIRGFEWSEPTLGHVNVWFSEDYTDVLDLGQMGPLYRWLARDDGPFGLGDGGAGAIAGFNHPGREPLRFSDFRYDARVVEQLVSLEMFNKRDDYLFEGFAAGKSSPLVACLNAGWRTGIAGVSDEHGTDWGFPEGKGRTGLWAREHSRAGVLAAMRARRFFATRTSGLRLDATADGVPMGGELSGDGDVGFAVEIDRGPDWAGRELTVQVLRPGSQVPTVADVVDVVVGRTTRFTVSISRDEGDWVLLRVADPTQANAIPGPAGHPGNDLGIAYTSPWWFA